MLYGLPSRTCPIECSGNIGHLICRKSMVFSVLQQCPKFFMMSLYKLFSVARQVPQNRHTINEKGSWAHRGLEMLYDFVDADNFRIVERCWRRLSIGYPKNDGR